MRTVIPKERVESENFGEYFIETETLIHMQEGDKHPLEVALGWLTKQNPTYSFSGVFDPKKGGAKVYWRPMELPGNS